MSDKDKTEELEDIISDAEVNTEDQSATEESAEDVIELSIEEKLEEDLAKEKDFKKGESLSKYICSASCLIW